MRVIDGARRCSTGYGNDNQAPVAGRIHGPDTEDHVVLGYGQGHGDGAACRLRSDFLRILPVGRSGLAPQNFVVGHRSRSGFPAQSRAVFELLGIDRDLRRFARRGRQSGQNRGIEPGNLCHVVEIYKLQHVAEHRSFEPGAGRTTFWC